MPQSLACIIVHCIFSTKERYPFFSGDVRPSIHAYLATVARDAGCHAYRVGGVADHVHLAIALPRTKSVADVIELLKTASSKWVKIQFPRLNNFAWQQGYGAFSIGASELENLIHYIDNQEEHHRVKTFQEEYRLFLSKYEIEYDERYVWD